MRGIAVAAFAAVPIHGAGIADQLPEFFSVAAKTVEATSLPADEPFTIVFLGDPEPRMRGNTDAELKAYIDQLVKYKTSVVDRFDYAGGSYRIDPSLVIIGGDISVDRGTSTLADMPVWKALEDNGIPFIAGFGNHDWDGYADYSITGDAANRATMEFCRATYERAAKIAAPYFGYQEFTPADSRGPMTFLAKYRGIQIANFNTFLYQPGYHYDFESPKGQECAKQKADVGWAGCQVFTSAEGQINKLEAALDTDKTTTTLFVHHYPISVADTWWDDASASNKSRSEMVQRLGGLLTRYDHSVLLTGHMHAYSKTARSSSSGKSFDEYVAPYFGGRDGEDLNVGGGFLALLVSRSKGILEVKHVPAPLAGSGPKDKEPTTTTTTTTTQKSKGDCVDTSILSSSNVDIPAIQACVTSKCFAAAVQCSLDTICSNLAAPLQNSGISDKDAAAGLWSLKPMLETNSRLKALASCLDQGCGTNILSTATCLKFENDQADDGNKVSTAAVSSSLSRSLLSWLTLVAMHCFYAVV